MDLVNSEPGAVDLARAVDADASLAAISAISLHEYLFGVQFKYGDHSEELKRKLASARNDLQRFEVIPFSSEIADTSSKVQADLARTGSQIGINDVYIAATALRYQLPLVTRNIRHFKRIPKLKLKSY